MDALLAVPLFNLVGLGEGVWRGDENKKKKKTDVIRMKNQTEGRNGQKYRKKTRGSSLLRTSQILSVEHVENGSSCHGVGQPFYTCPPFSFAQPPTGRENLTGNTPLMELLE